MAAKSVEGIGHDALVAILTDREVSLRVDAREVKIARFLPQAFSQREMPVVVVERPEVVSSVAWDNGYDQIVLGAKFIFLDWCGASAGKEDEASERAALLAARTRAALALEANLRMAFLHCYESMTNWTRGEGGALGNNLRGVEFVLRFGVLVGRGKVWDV